VQVHGTSSESLLVPKVGMAFKSEEDAYEFYNEYAGKNGFSIRKSHSKLRPDNFSWHRDLLRQAQVLIVQYHTSQILPFTEILRPCFVHSSKEDTLNFYFKLIKLRRCYTLREDWILMNQLLEDGRSRHSSNFFPSCGQWPMFKC
jgi:hypothetical protein